MRVDFYTSLRPIVGVKSVEISLSGEPTLRLLLDEMINRYPKLQTELFNGNGQIHGHVHISVNGRNIPFLENGLDTTLSTDDRVSIFPAVGGG